MAVLRQARESAVRRRYHRAAVIYLVLGLLVLYLTRLLPGVRRAPEPDWLLPLAVLAMLAAAILTWRGSRLIAIVASLFALYRAVVLGLSATGRHFGLRPEAEIPETLADPDALKAFFDAEIATASPFFEWSQFEPYTVRLPDTVSDVLGSPAFAATQVFLVCALIQVIVVLVLWRAARHAV